GGRETDLDAHLGVDAGRGQLLLRLLGVTAVGHEQRMIPGDEQHRGRAREAREVPNVGELRDEQRVDLLAREALAQASDPRWDVEGDELGHARSSSLAAT